MLLAKGEVFVLLETLAILPESQINVVLYAGEST